MDVTTQEQAAAKTPKKRKPPARSCRIETTPAGEQVLVLTIGKRIWHYWLKPIPSEIGGHGFRLTKFAAERVPGQPDAYDLLILPTVKGPDGEDIDPSTCDCRGFEAHRHCKHRDSIKALIADGQLTVQQ